MNSQPSPQNFTVDYVVSSLRTADFISNPAYQRGLVWSKRQQQGVLTTILRGWDLPKFYIRERIDGRSEIIDGQQRCHALQSFLKNEIALDLSNVPDNFVLEKHSVRELDGRRYEELPVEVRNHVRKYLLQFMEIKNIIDDETRAMFQALNQGTRLSKGDKLNAMCGLAPEKVRPLMEHPIFGLVKKLKKDRRLANLFELAHHFEQKVGEVAKTIALEELMDSFQYRGTDQLASFDSLKKDLDFVSKAIQATDLKSKAMGKMVPFGFLTPWIIARHWLQITHSKFNTSEFSIAVKSMLSKIEEGDAVACFCGGLGDGRQQTSLAERVNVCQEFLIDSLKLKPLDPRRFFTEQERVAVYRDNGGVCKMGHPIDFDDATVDHTVAHVNGGETSMGNADLLCRSHNSQKKDKI